MIKIPSLFRKMLVSGMIILLFGMSLNPSAIKLVDKKSMNPIDNDIVYVDDDFHGNIINLSLRPNADIVKSWIPNWGTENYYNVNKPFPIPSYYIKTSTSNLEDIFEIDDHTSEIGEILNVTIKAFMFSFMGDSIREFRMFIINGLSNTRYDTSIFNLTEEFESGLFCYTWNVNPKTGENWNWNEIDYLQIGINATSVSQELWCMQLYIDVEYMAGNETPGWQVTHFNNIQNAVEIVSTNGTVFIYDGTYYDKFSGSGGTQTTVLIKRPMKIIGESKTGVILNVTNLAVARTIEIIAPDVSISQMTIINPDAELNGGQGIAIIAQDYGDYAFNIYNISISNVTINADGSVWISEAPISGLNFYLSNITIRDCDLSGVIDIRSIFGAQVQDIYLINNTIHDGYLGIHLRKCFNINVVRNIIYNLDYGMYISNSSSNIIYHNKFINNIQNAYDECDNIWDDGYPSGGNFWDDYNGTDTDGDGIGDIPYLIPGDDNEDRYPLGNFVPTSPEIDGPTKCKPGIDYDYNFTASDPDGDEIWYHICWGDKEIIYTYGPYTSGEEITLSYNWTDKGAYTITCWASDVYDGMSIASTLEVNIPRIRLIYNILLLRLFERFTLLERLLNIFN